ncbi:MAG: hypothetical protein JXA13_14745 [Anaerolineales bacterium]|nr:hypothetical protein [Anaerolineales bacterium]
MSEKPMSEMDPEVWLHYLLIAGGDVQVRQELIERISQNSGVSPENVEQILHALTQVLMNQTRQN